MEQVDYLGHGSFVKSNSTTLKLFHMIRNSPGGNATFVEPYSKHAKHEVGPLATIASSNLTPPLTHMIRNSPGGNATLVNPYSKHAKHTYIASKYTDLSVFIREFDYKYA